MAKQRPKRKRGKRGEGHAEVVEGNLVKALSHPLRARALAILNEQVASPKQISVVLGKPVGNVSYHVIRLRELGCVEMVKTRQRRGATEHFYRGVTRSFLNDENWAGLKGDAKNGISIVGLKMINDSSREAILAGTFDARANRHLSRSPLNVDDEGWEELMDLLESTLEGVFEIQAKSTGRLAESGNKSVRATISLLGFESPAGEQAAQSET
jgi:DNA-binding transcriptional ArsR family regulator